MKRLFAILVLAMVCPLAQAEPVPEKFSSDVVAFLCDLRDKTNFVPIGTCFFVSQPYKAIPGMAAPYMVTAKHVLFDKDGNLPPEAYLRMTLKEGGVAYGAINLRKPNGVKVYTHPDPSVDIAVVHMVPNDPTLRIETISTLYITAETTFDSFHIRPGDEMFFLGLFTPFYGSQANIPIYRFGHLSLITQEKIPFESGRPPESLYLMESQVFGGNSGSPAFFRFSASRLPNDTQLLLAGVVKGYYYDRFEVEAAETARLIPVSRNNVGIAAITPAHFLKEILECDELKNERELYEKTHATAPTVVITNPPPSVVTNAPEASQK